MITWVQKYLQKHFRTVFAIVLASTIISLVIAYNPSGGFGRGSGASPRASQRFFDLDLNSPEDQQRLVGDASVSRYLQVGYSLPQDEQLINFAEMRYAALHLADEFHLPAPTTEEINSYLFSLPAFANPDTHQFDRSRYNAFRDQLKTDPRLTESDVARVLADDVRAGHLENLLAGPGHVLPGDVRSQLELAESSWNIALATVDYNAYNPTISPTDAELAKYFADNSARYEIPAQVRVDAIEFSADTQMARATATDADVRAYYDTDPSRFPKPPAPPALLAAPKTAETPAGPDADFNAVKADVEKALKLDRARRLATKEAAAFSRLLVEKKVTPDTLTPLLAEHAATLRPVAPFARDAAPAELGTNRQTASDAAFKLGPAHPFSDAADALTTEKGGAVLVWRETIPSRQPAYAEAKERVAADFIAAEKKRRFAELGKTIRDSLGSSLKAGITFEKAVAEAADKAGVKAETKTYPAFTLREHATASVSDVLLNRVVEELPIMKGGQLSDMITLAGQDGSDKSAKGILLYVSDKKVPDLTPANPQYVAVRNQLARQLAAYAGNASLAQLVQQENARSAAVTP